jgi:hypothetical protein
MANYDDDPIAKCIGDYWSDNPEAAWSKYKERFATATKAERISKLRNVDLYFGDEIKPTREAAAMLRRKRELEHAHWALVRIGR